MIMRMCRFPNTRFLFGHYGAAFTGGVYDDAFKFVSLTKSGGERSYFWPLLVWTAGSDGSGVYVHTH